MPMNRDHFWLTDRQFARIAPHLPTDTRGKPRVDDRRVISGIVHVLKSRKARWFCEQAHQQLKEELGLDHFEGRSWSGVHRHALMSMIAFLYLQHRRLEAAK